MYWTYSDARWLSTQKTTTRCSASSAVRLTMRSRRQSAPRRSLIVRLAQQGLIETLESETDEPLLPRRAVVQHRHMQRMRRDLRVNFTGATIILDLGGRMEELNRELAEVRGGSK